MWLNRGLLSSNSFMELSVREYLLKSFAKQSKILNRGIYYKQNKFRTVILPKGYNIEIRSRALLCSGIENNNKLASIKNKNSLSKKEDSETDFDGIEEIDNLAELLDDVKEDEFSTLNYGFVEEHINYLAKIANGDEAVLERLKPIYAILRNTTESMGLDLEIELYDWDRLLECNPNGLKRNLKFQIVKQLRKKQKSKRMIMHPLVNIPERVKKFDIDCYHLFHNSLFLRFYKTSCMYQDVSKGLISMLYSPALIFDCSYESFMRKEEIENLAKQLGNVLSVNFKSVFPLHIVICNFNKTLYLAKIIERYIQNFYANSIPITVTEKNYLDIFNKEDLCYLSPDGERIIDWNSNKNYIVGAFVDKKNCNMKISLAKAKMEGIDHVRFPIDKFVNWKRGSKSLNLPVVTEIVSQMYFYNDWEKAFEKLPRRFLVDDDSYIEKHKHSSGVLKAVNRSYNEVKPFEEINSKFE